MSSTFVSSSFFGLHAGFSTPSREDQKGGMRVFFFFLAFFFKYFFFLSMVLVGRVGNVASYLGWTGCLRSGKEEGAKEST